MSERNGDRARFQRERKRKTLRRKRARKLRQGLAAANPTRAALKNETAAL